jgi:hypothetical protein
MEAAPEGRTGLMMIQVWCLSKGERLIDVHTEEKSSFILDSLFTYKAG